MSRTLRWVLAALVCLTVVGCTSGTGPAPGAVGAGATTASGVPPAGCHTDVLAGWRAAGLAVLWVPASGLGLALPSRGTPAVAAMDVRTGAIRSYCELPGIKVLPTGVSIPMRQGGQEYPADTADLELMLRTHWFSPDFRWAALPDRDNAALVDVAAGAAMSVDWGGALVGLGRNGALVRTDRGTARWCLRPLPPAAGPTGPRPCTPLPARAGPGSYLIGPAGQPVWVPARAVPLRFGRTTIQAVTDGSRLYRADTETAAARRAADRRDSAGGPAIRYPSVDLDPAGLGGFQTDIAAQPAPDPAGWFTVAAGRAGIETRYHHTTATRAAYSWMYADASSVSRAVVDGGSVAITAALDGRRTGPDRSTRFGALVDGTDKVVDLTGDRGLRCPRPGVLCRIIAWPDGSVATSS